MILKTSTGKVIDVSELDPDNEIGIYIENESIWLEINEVITLIKFLYSQLDIFNDKIE